MKVLSRLLGFGADAPPPLSPKESVILRLLAARGELYGLQIVAESDGEVGRGTVYVTLGRMSEKKFVISRTEHQPDGATGLPRRLYQITGEGQRVLQAYERAALAFTKMPVAT